MISYEEFQVALKTVNEYILQLNVEVEFKEKKIKNIPIFEWINIQKNKKVTNSQHNKLFNFLEKMSNYEDERYKYIEDFEHLDLTKFRNSGKIVQNAFNDLYEIK